MGAFGGVSSRRTLNTRMATLIGMLAIGGTTGTVRFVHSGTGTAGSSAVSSSNPTTTIDQAIGLCTASKGDVVICMPGHTEDVGSSGSETPCVLDVAGVRVIGVGEGTHRPTLTIAATDGTVAMNAANCSLENFLILCTEDVTVCVDVNATDCTVRAVEIRSKTTATAKEFVTGIDVNGGGANACDRTKIIDCIGWSPTAGSSQFVELGEVADSVEIRGCTVWGDYANACVHNPTGKVLTRLLVADCFLENTQTGNHSLELVSACTGMLVRNMYKNDMTQATGSDPGSCNSFECYHCDTIDVNGILSPAGT
jgi:hypothetical protein